MSEEKETPQLSDSSPQTSSTPDSTAPEIRHGHNASLQHHVEPNSDLALHLSREHQHAHLHHSARASVGHPEEVVYSKGTTFEKSNIPDQDPQDHELHRRYHPEKHHAEKNGITYDAEQAKDVGPIQSEEEDPQGHKFARFYAHWRIFFHIFIWLLFTGYVAPQLRDVSCFLRRSLSFTTAAFGVYQRLEIFETASHCVPKLRTNLIH
jgi:hypothetical protein